jgi:hypothetical protein
VYLQINTVKYDADQEIMNIYENLQIVQSHFFTDMLLFINLVYFEYLLVYRYSDFIANEYKQIIIHSLLTIRNIWSGI